MINGILGVSSSIVKIHELINHVSSQDTSVLITGPSGSGKERVARAIHDHGKRHDKPFVSINCGAIPRDLIESELFGHEKGSFTGASAQRIGKFESARGGTVFLDEIGDMPSDMQVKLLRVLEERTIERVGGTKSIAIDVRIVSATHRDLEWSIGEGRFREDLYYRLAVFPIDVPPLSARTDDIQILITHFQKTLAGASFQLSASALQALVRHPWPGNVRELRNFVERASILHAGETIDQGHVDALLLRARPPRDQITMTPTIMPDRREIDPAGIDLRAILDDLESRYIGEALSRTNGVVADAARLLGLRRTTLIEKMRRHAA